MTSKWVTAAPWRIGIDRDTARIHPVPPDRRLDPPSPGSRPPADEREVLPRQLPLADHALKSPVRLRVARDHEEAGRVAVEPVDDSRPFGLRAAAIPRPSRPWTRVPLAMTRRGMDDESRRLVDDEQALVLVGDDEIELLGLERRLAPLGQVERDIASFPDQPVALRPRPSVNEHPTLANEALGLRTGADRLGRPPTNRSRRSPAMRPGRRPRAVWSCATGSSGPRSG